MPVKYTVQLASNPGENIYYVADSGTSPLDIFAAAAMYNKKRGYRFRPWTKRSGVSQYNANLIAYQPFMKADSLITGDIEVWKAEKELSERDRRIIMANSAIGMAAAPAAIYSAVKTAQSREGGVPRDVARALVKRRPLKGTKASAKVNRVLESLETGRSKKAIAAAGILGATAVGLQLGASTGDIIANRATRNMDES